MPIPLFRIKVREKGQIRDIREIIARVDGLPSCLNGQIVDMGDGVQGIVMGFDHDSVLVLILGDPARLRMGRDVASISEPFKIPVGEALLGRMVDALGRPCDGGEPVAAEEQAPAFRGSPPLTHRRPADGFLVTGSKMVDALIPIAKGQRQLLLGDRLTGKTVLGLDAIISQRDRNCVCIYCCVGKSVSGLEKAVAMLHQNKALPYTVVVAATDNAPVGEQYMAPFSAASIGEFFAVRGRDVLVVFDDLTKHAWAYREVSLLLDRPPGREAYPGDIFYVQVQLMERAGRFNEQHGGGSMTFLGVAETLQGDLTGYIPSNLASMCDGQIVFSTSVFAEGVRPAIDFGLSLSIIGGRVQPPILRELASGLRADYARYTEVLRLSRLSSGVSDESRHTLDKGNTMMVLLQQAQNQPAGIGETALLLYALDRELVMQLNPAQQKAFRKSIAGHAAQSDPGLLEEVEARGKLLPEIEKRMERVIQECAAAAEEA